MGETVPTDLAALTPGFNNVRCFAIGTRLATAHMLDWPVTGWGRRAAKNCPTCAARIALGMHPLSTESPVSND